MRQLLEAMEDAKVSLLEGLVQPGTVMAKIGSDVVTIDRSEARLVVESLGAVLGILWESCGLLEPTTGALLHSHSRWWDTGNREQLGG